MNLETIIDAPLWYKIWQLSGYNPTRVKKTKTSQETKKSLQKFLEPTRKPKVIYTDNSIDFGKTCEELSWNHSKSTPHRSETNGIAERVVRRVKEGTSAVLLQSSLDENWWADSMECYCYLRNIQDLSSDGKTHMRDVLRNHLTDQLYRLEQPIVTASIWSYNPARYIPRICVVRGWNLERRHLGPDIEELEQMDASEIYAKRLNAKEVLTPMSGEKFMFPIAEGTVKLSGGDQVLRTSTLIRDRPDRREEQGNLQRESDGSSSTALRDSPSYDGETGNDS